MAYRLLYSGRLSNVAAWVDSGGDCAAETFLMGLDDRQLRSIWTRITRAADHGAEWNPHHCRKLEGEDFFEFKSPLGVRLFWHWGPARLIVVLCGYIKQSDRTPRVELERARRLYALSTEEIEQRGARYV